MKSLKRKLSSGELEDSDDPAVPEELANVGKLRKERFWKKVLETLGNVFNYISVFMERFVFLWIFWKGLYGSRL